MSKSPFSLPNLPKLRFKGFDGEILQIKQMWEVGEIFGTGCDKEIKNNEEPVFLINFMDVYLNSKINGNSIQTTTSCTISELSKYKVQNEDLLITPSSETKDDIGICSYIELSENTKNIVYSYHLNLIRINKLICHPLYITYQLKSYKSKKYFYKISQGATRFTLSIDNIKSAPLLVPPLLEQQKIAKFFSLLDKQIELWETKLKLNEQIKKYFLKWTICLDGMSNLPKLRFNGFVDEWEGKELETLCKIKTGNCDLINKEKDGKYPLFVRSDKIERINNYAFDCEAILIPGDGRIGEIFHYINGKFNFHQRVYCIYECNQDLKFIYFGFQKNLKKYLKSFSAKATVDSIRLPMLQKFIISTPSILEQQKIVKFFSLLDKQVEFIKFKIRNMNRVKKYFYNKIFI